MKKNLLDKLKQMIKLQSVNSLKNVFPDDIIDWLDITDIEAKELIDELHEQRIIIYKYKFKCVCGEICTIYEKTIKRNSNFFCEVCGREFSYEDISKYGYIAYEIDKNELENYGQERVNFVELPEVKNKIVPIASIQGGKSMEIFIGSSSEAVEFMEKIAIKLEELEITPLTWNATGKGIFIASTNTIDALISIAHRVKAAIFVFNSDDKIWNEKTSIEESNCVRDNVLFEYGLFMGALGKQRVCFVCKGNPKIASDLKGITYIDGDSGDYHIKSKLGEWIDTIK